MRMLKHILSFLLFTFIVFSVKADNIKVACVGNSITEGFGLENPSMESYPAILQSLLGDDYEVENFGLSARTLLMKGDLPYMKEQRFKDALEFLPDIVTIKLGTNDSKPHNWLHKDDFRHDLNTLLDSFSALSSSPKIYLCLPIPSDNKGWGINDSIIYNCIIPIIKEVAGERNISMIDLNTAMRPYYPNEYQDGVHPNKYGARIIAETIYKSITGMDLLPELRRPEMVLWYDEPAAQWEETLPLGNGRLGMMPDGGTDKERIVLNEISMWSGSEADYLNPEASTSLSEIRRLLFKGKNKEAQELMYKSFVPKKPEKGGTYGAYQMLADMDIEYSYPVADESMSDYRRWLDLSESVAYTSFRKGGVNYVREYYVSRTADVMVVHIKADKGNSISFKMSLGRPERGEVRSPSDGKLLISGELDSGSKARGVRYSAITSVVGLGDKAERETGENYISVRNADEAWLFVSAKTSYLNGEV